MTSWEKYSAKAIGWSEAQYADARGYLTRRAELVRLLGPPLAPGDLVLDLACGDGGLADFLPEQRYVGVDASEEMIAAGLARGRELVLADLNDYEPPQPVQATTIFRAIYYARAGVRHQPEAVPACRPPAGPPGRRLRPARRAPLLRAADTRAAAVVRARPPRPRADRARRGAPAPLSVHPPVLGFAPGGSFVKK